jgi:uncharacterized protein (DUF433 family)
MDWRNYIHSNPNILLGKPVVKGTRLSVEFVLGLFAAGWTESQILDSYPTLNTELLKLIEVEKLQFEGRFTVIDRSQVRQRPLPEDRST